MYLVYMPFGVNINKCPFAPVFRGKIKYLRTNFTYLVHSGKYNKRISKEQVICLTHIQHSFGMTMRTHTLYYDNITLVALILLPIWRDRAFRWIGLGTTVVIRYRSDCSRVKNRLSTPRRG